MILALSADIGEIKPAVEKAVNELAVRGFRSLGVAKTDVEGRWQFLGVLPLFDPPREDAKATIATALAMGVKIKMVTGDALAIAQETAKKLEMGANILDASSLGDSNKQETTVVSESIEKADGFAQVFPEHKFHIVDVLQKRGHIVGMTGDRVNDAPALKKADFAASMYLKLSVAGHLTIFLTRTRGPFWTIRPSTILLVAVLGTQLAATLIAVYGLFMTPLGWGWAFVVWVYVLAWFLVNDRIKLLAYRILDPVKARTPSDLTLQIGKQAHGYQPVQ